MSAAPLISIIVPIYNVEAYLRECLNSVIAQTYGNWECILVDDASTDSSASIAAEFCEADSRFRLLRHAENRGLSEARNSGLDSARGELIVFIDSDDYVGPEMLALGVENLADGVDIVGFGFEEGDASVGFTTGREALARVLFQTGFLNSSVCGKIFRRHIFDSLRFTPRLAYEDLDLIDRIFLRADKVCVVRRRMYYYRMRGGSILHTWNSKRLDVLAITERIEERLAGDPLLARAARVRRFAANFNLLLLMRKNGLRKSPEADSCRRQLKRLHREVLTNRSARPKDRLGALLIALIG